MALKVGVIGMGGLGAMHFNLLSGMDGVELVAVCDCRPEQMQPDKAEAGINIETGGEGQAGLAEIRKYTDYRELLAAETLDVAIIATPTFLHKETVLAALATGAHVLCEKPIALNSGDAREMVAAAQAAGRTLMVGHVIRFWPEYVLVKEMIDSGQFGHVRSAVFRRTGGVPTWGWEDWFLDSDRSGHAAIDLHVHDVDAVQWFFGQPASVTASGVFEPDGGCSHIVATYAFGDAALPSLVVAEGGWGPKGAPFYMTLEVEFEAVSVVMDSRMSPTISVYYADGQVTHPEVPERGGYELELEYFVQCIAQGRGPDRCPATQSANAVAIVESEVESARSGKPVTLLRSPVT